MASRSDISAIVRRATSCPHGWHRIAGASSTGHPILELPSGERVQVAFSPGDVNSARNLARALEDACGCERGAFWARAGVGKRSRKAPTHTDFDLGRAARENERFRASGADRAVLPERHAELVAELLAVNPRREPSRTQDLATEICELERRMDAAHIYYKPAAS